MRTKTLLLSAAALLAAGIVSSQAQVYSQNIVGYANVATPSGGSYYMLTVPFVIGASNGVNEVFGTTLPNGSAIYTWNSGNQTFSTVVYDATGGNNSLPFSWFLADDTTPAPTMPMVKPGVGFFLVPNSPITNIFAGTIAVNVGTSNQMALTSGGSYYMVASAVPYTGFVTNGNNSTGGANLNGLPNGSAVYQWNSELQKFTTSVFDASGGNNSLPDVWFQGDDTTPAPCPQINVGEGIFVVPNASYTWTTGL